MYVYIRAITFLTLMKLQNTLNVLHTLDTDK